MRKQATQEQKEKAEARREKFKGLCKRIAEMSDVERAEIVMQSGAVITCEGHALSDKNTMMLLLQRPGVSVVGGFRQWKKAGRYVMKGQAGLSVWIPRASKSEGSPAGPGSEITQREIVETAEGDGTAEGGQGARRRFLVGTVFDISQTCEAGAESADTQESGEVESSPASSCEVVGVYPGEDGNGGTEAVIALEGGRYVNARDLAPSGLRLLPPPAVLVVSSVIGPCVSAPAVAAETVPSWEVVGREIVQHEAARVLAPIRTIWDSPDGSGGPLLICAPPADYKRKVKHRASHDGDLFSLSTSSVESEGR